MNRNIWPKISLLANLVLGITVIALAFFRPSPQASDTAGVQRSGEPTKPEHATQRPSNEPRLADRRAAAGTGQGWQQWIDSLRAAGVPNRMLARLVQFDFDDRWQKKQEELQQKYDRGELDYDALTALAQEHDADQEKELRAALGEDGFKAWDQESIMQNLNLSKLSLNQSETNSIYDWQKELQRQYRELEKAKQKGEVDEADYVEKQDKLRTGFEEKLKNLLGPDRYAAMQGINDGSGDLRRSLRDLNATDAQFQDLLQAQRQWTDRRAELDKQLQQNKSQGTTYEDQIQAIDVARDQEYQRVLGTNGFDAYQKSQDGRYTTMKRYAESWGMDDTQIDYTYHTLKYYEKSIDDYERQARALEAQGKVVDWDAVHKNVQQFGKQTEQALHSYLGDDRFNKMKRNQLLPFNQGE